MMLLVRQIIITSIPFWKGIYLITPLYLKKNTLNKLHF